MTKPRLTTLHRRIKELRELGEKTQEELADFVGVHKTAVSHWETGHSAPRAGAMEKVAEFLGVKVADLFREAA